MAQLVKTPSAKQETPVRFLGWEEGMATHSSILVWRIPKDRGGLEGYNPWGRKELDMTERLSHTHTRTHTRLTEESLMIGPYDSSCPSFLLDLKQSPHMSCAFTSTLKRNRRKGGREGWKSQPHSQLPVLQRRNKWVDLKTGTLGSPSGSETTPDHHKLSSYLTN